MKIKDRIKEEIGLEKLLMTLLVAVISSLSSWAYNNEESLLKEIVYFLYSLSFILGIIAAISFTKIKLKIKELDSYE
jgi:uncharacterized membrane protein YphA (DoxX/SURF4 family)